MWIDDWSHDNEGLSTDEGLCVDELWLNEGLMANEGLWFDERLRPEDEITPFWVVLAVEQDRPSARLECPESSCWR